MSDFVKGVAILDESVSPIRLHFVCVRKNGDRPPWDDSIPVRPASEPEDPKVMTWEFAERGTTLTVAPSVKMTHLVWDDDPQGNRIPGTEKHVEDFHNASEWTVEFVRWAPPPGCEDRWAALSSMMRVLNPKLLK